MHSIGLWMCASGWEVGEKCRDWWGVGDGGVNVDVDVNIDTSTTTQPRHEKRVHASVVH